ncbi:MAG: metallophosphoesterase [Arenimonas sp.]
MLLPGDFVIQEVLGGTFIAPEELAMHLKPLLEDTKVYAVLGNHDAWLDGKRVQSALENGGIQVLEDRALPITKNQCRFWLVGLSDYIEGMHEYQQAFAMVPKNSSTLVFTHSPDAFPEMADSEFSLMIAGHTHGGQVVLPFLGRPIVPSIYGQRYAIGHIREKNQHLFVTPGIGTSILPVRFGVPPEISYLRLQSDQGNVP